MNLFVYGTLAPGEPNAHTLAGIEGTWRQGTVRGNLYSSGWGAALGFPGIVLDPKAECVNGQVFSSPELERHLTRLDEFEGGGYQRVTTTVVLDSGESVPAFVDELSEQGRK